MLTSAQLHRAFDQATEATQNMMEYYGDWETSPIMINSGYCHEWASYALGYIQEQETELVHIRHTKDDLIMPLHFWLYYYGKHYDAECYEGVQNDRDLPIFQRAREC